MLSQEYVLVSCVHLATFTADIHEETGAFVNINNLSVKSTALAEPQKQKRTLGLEKRYEFTNHLGNVLAVTTDRPPAGPSFAGAMCVLKVLKPCC